MAHKRPGAYVRVARPEELHAVSEILTRAFINDPAMSWYCCAKATVSDIDCPTPAEKKAMRNLRWLQELIAKSTVALDGLITVVAIPSAHDAAHEDSGVEERAAFRKEDGLPRSEEVIAAALWLSPGKTLDAGPITFIRCGVLKALYGCGFTGLKRLLFDFSPKVEHTLEVGFKSRGLDRLDSWHLLEIVVEPKYQGSGYASMLMMDGFERATGKPVHLETTREKNREMYEHFGFEIDEAHTFGVGTVDKDGIKADGETATGFVEWVMTRWTTP